MGISYMLKEIVVNKIKFFILWNLFFSVGNSKWVDYISIDLIFVVKEIRGG